MPPNKPTEPNWRKLQLTNETVNQLIYVLDADIADSTYAATARRLSNLLARTRNHADKHQRATILTITISPLRD